MALRLLLDTNRYADLGRQLPEVVERIAHADAVVVPFVVLAELRAGFRKGGRQEKNERQLAAFLDLPHVGVLYASPRTVDTVVDVLDHLRRRGTPIPAHDVWIAALALQHDLTLYSRDAHFENLPQVRRI